MALRLLYRFRWYRRLRPAKWVLLKDGWYRLDKIPVTPMPFILEDDLTLRQDYQQFINNLDKEKTE